MFAMGMIAPGGCYSEHAYGLAKEFTQVSLKSLIRQQKPLTVSLISFLLMLAIVVVIGLVGGRHIIAYLQERLVEHGIDHNEEVIMGMHPLLEHSLQDGVKADVVVADFQRFIEHAEPFGVRLFLVDLSRNMVIADSLETRHLPYPVQDLARTPVRRFDGSLVADVSQWDGTVWRTTSSGAVELLTLHPLQMPQAARQHWALGVSSDLSELLVLMDELHLHLDSVLLLTYGLIGLLGFLVLRWVGRRYESGLEQQVAARTRELEKAHEKLLEQARLATIGQTASVLAHEMRNPLASIKLALSGVSRSDNLQEREKQRMALVLGEVDRLENMLSENLEYVHPVVRDEQPVALDDLLDKVLELEQPMMDSASLVIQRQRCSDCPRLRLDTRKMQQVLLNLLRNAREASPAGGQVKVLLQRVDKELMLVISNRGEGLSNEIREQAFDLFFTTKARGTGLGLGLVKRVVEEHGGSVSLAEDRDGNISVSVILPLKE
jgi:signal transduction histidine kinase